MCYREKFNRRFLLTPIVPTFVINKPGDGKEFAAQYADNPDIEVSSSSSSWALLPEPSTTRR